MASNDHCMSKNMTRITKTTLIQKIKHSKISKNLIKRVINLLRTLALKYCTVTFLYFHFLNKNLFL